MTLSCNSEFIKLLRRNGELIEIDYPVSPDLEITEITDRISKQKNGGKAILFKKTGTEFPLVINALGSQKRIELAFGGRNPDFLAKTMGQIVNEFSGTSAGFIKKLGMLPKLRQLGSWMPKKLKKKGRCQEVVMDNPDLGKLPVLTCWPHDGGPFITLPLVHTIDPDNGKPNLGMYRMQVIGPKTSGMHWHMHKTGAKHYRAYRKKGEKMPVAVALGGDPVYTYCATAPLPDGIDEYLLAGYIRQKSVKLVKCLTQDIWVPQDADIIIEGYVDPSEELILEGPFGDHTGFYSLADYYPEFHVTCISHRKDAVYPATIVGIPPQEDAAIALVTEKLFLPPIKMSMIPELIDMHMPVAGVAHNLALFSINQEYPGQGKKVINTIYGAGQMMFTKFAIVAGSDVNIRNYKDLAKAVCRKVDPRKNLSITEGPMDVLDHSSREFAFGGKMGIDATGKDLGFQIPDPKKVADLFASFRVNNPDVKDVNISLLSDSIPVVAVSYKKIRINQFREFAKDLNIQFGEFYLPFWIFTDDNVNIKDLFQLAWIVGSHTDPGRDTLVLDSPDEKSGGRLFVDATRKTRKYDNFERDWPNPVLMDRTTINRIDDMWNKLDAGSKPESPSNYYRPLEEEGDAVVKES